MLQDLHVFALLLVDNNAILMNLLQLLLLCTHMVTIDALLYSSL
jgi:hypothetical protein